MRKLIVANWKMNKNIKESISTVKELRKLLNDVEYIEDVDVVVCPPFTSLLFISEQLKRSKIKLGAQNMYFEEYGAYTGEESPLMIKDVGCEYVILGHSERREIFGEDSSLINKKLVSALGHSLKPILCIGENLEQRTKGKTKEVICNQIKDCLVNIDNKQLLNITIAYEPIWAISKGDYAHKSASPQDAEEVHKFIRSTLSDMFDETTAKNTRIIYGGSINPKNSEGILSMQNIDGGLVGNASLDAKSFAQIVMSCKER